MKITCRSLSCTIVSTFPISVTGRGEEVENMTEEEKKGLQLYIDPTECINCLCLYECPVKDNL